MKEDANMKYPVSPLDVVTGRFKPETIVYEDRGFIVAYGQWKDKGLPGIGIRWHVPGEIGYPNGFGKPQWMETPIRLDDIASLNNPVMPEAVTVTLRGNPRSIPIGDWAFDGTDWHLIYGLYGHSGHTVEACGLGKRGSYPLDVSRIQAVEGARSLMDVWFKDRMNGDALLWTEPTGRVYLTMPTRQRHEWTLNGPNNLFTKFELRQSPATGEWSFSNTEPMAFDYSLDECFLLARASLADEKAGSDDMLKTFEDILNDHDFKWCYEDYIAGKFKKRRRQFVTDFPEEERKGIYRNDIVAGASYYDLTLK